MEITVNASIDLQCGDARQSWTVGSIRSTVKINLISPEKTGVGAKEKWQWWMEKIGLKKDNWIQTQRSFDLSAYRLLVSNQRT